MSCCGSCKRGGACRGNPNFLYLANRRGRRRKNGASNNFIYEANGRRKKRNPLTTVEAARIAIAAARLRRRAITKHRKGSKARAALLGMSAGLLRSFTLTGRRVPRVSRSVRVRRNGRKRRR